MTYFAFYRDGNAVALIRVEFEQGKFSERRETVVKRGPEAAIQAEVARLNENLA